MTTPTHAQREPELAGQTVVVIGGSAGIGFETARRARTEVRRGHHHRPQSGPARTSRSSNSARKRSMAFDANDSAALQRFFQELPAPIDHVLVTAGGPRYGPLLDMDKDDVRQALGEHVIVGVGRRAQRRRQDATGRHTLAHGRHRWPANQPRSRHRVGGNRGLPPFTAALALELAPCASISSLPGSSTRHCRRRFSATGSRPAATSCADAADRPGGGPADVAALAVHIMTNTALTGATYDIDGGEQFVA